MTNVLIQSTDRDAIDSLDTILSQLRGKAKAQGWVAAYAKRDDGSGEFTIAFSPIPKPKEPPDEADVRALPEQADQGRGHQAG